ncbi:MAG TPA: hypothetical protein VG692_13420 [Gemmatimonadales bacterium]|nr:hypothetical protein [Gemmatimonadales bacterium]
MPFVSILAAPGENTLEIVTTPQPVRVPHPPSAEGTFGPKSPIVVFQREVPDPDAVLARLRIVLGDARADRSRDVYACAAPVAIRVVEVIVAELWPPNRLVCQDCKRHFVAPIAEARRMYLACPHCHNPMLNPRWDSA